MAPASRSDARTPMAAWVALGGVCVLSLFNYLDRMLLAAVTPLVKREFALSDTYVGLLSASFAVVYAVGGVPLGRLTDHYSRRAIIAITAALWSVMTAVCGLATSYWTLFFARVGVSVCEAGNLPACYSMLSDYFTPARRNFAIGAQIAFASLGVVIGLAAGGWLAQLYGWRAAFILLGAPGLVLAGACYLVMREPPRGAMDAPAAAAEPPPSVRAGLAILARKPVFVWLSLTAGFNAFCALGMVQWLPSFFARAHGMSLGVVGVLFGIAFGVGLGLGQVSGGLIGTRLARGGVYESIRLCIVSNILVAPAFLVVLWSPSPAVAIAAVFVAAFVGAIGHPAQGAGVQNAMPPRLRGMGQGVYTLAISVLGMAVGPLVVGMMSDAFTAASNEAEALRYALTASQLIFAAAALCAWRAYGAGRSAGPGLVQPAGA